MKPKQLALLAVALGCGLIAAIGINQLLGARHVEPTESGLKLDVCIAKSKIGVGDTIKLENINLVPFPQENVPPDAITKLEDLQGRRAKSLIHPGVPILEGQLLAKGEKGEDVTEHIPVGMRLAPVRVDNVSGVAGLVKPGDHVDVVVHLRENQTLGLLSSKTITFLQNVKVLAVDDVFRRDNDGQTAVIAKTISFVLTPEQAEMLTTASELGTIRLIMRRPDDDAITVSKGFSAREIFGQPVEPTPAPALSPERLVSLAPVPPAKLAPLPPVAPEAKKNTFMMRIYDGAVPRDITFEDGKPVSTAGLNSANPMPTPSGTAPVSPSPTSAGLSTANPNDP